MGLLQKSILALRGPHSLLCFMPRCPWDGIFPKDKGECGPMESTPHGLPLSPSLSTTCVFQDSGLTTINLCQPGQQDVWCSMPHIS